MEKSKEKRFSDISKEVIAKTQNELDCLCAAHDLESWNVTTKQAPWRELVLRLCGLPYDNTLKQPAENRGRPSEISDEQKKNIAEFIEIHHDFSPINENGEVEKQSTLPNLLDFILVELSEDSENKVKAIFSGIEKKIKTGTLDRIYEDYRASRNKQNRLSDEQLYKFSKIDK